MLLITKAFKDTQNFCLHFKFWSSFIQLKIEKVIGYYYFNLFMAKVSLTQKPGNLIELTKWVKNSCGRTIFFIKDVTPWSFYLVKTLFFRTCFSNILLAQINYFAPNEYKSQNLTIQLMSFNFATYRYRDNYWDKFFVSFKKTVSWQRVVHHQCFVHSRIPTKDPTTTC